MPDTLSEIRERHWALPERGGSADIDRLLDLIDIEREHRMECEAALALANESLAGAEQWASEAASGLEKALATAIEGGYSDESIDIARYSGDPIYHAVVWEIRKYRANLDGPETVREPHDA